MEQNYLNDYNRVIDKIVKKMVSRANAGKMRENYGDKELRKFNNIVNNDKGLSYGEKAELSGKLSEKLATISQNKKGIYEAR